jgi:hypothetical protein
VTAFEDKIVAADALATRLAAYDWPFDAERGAEIDAHWDKRHAANPKLFDGAMLMARRVEERRDAAGGLTLSAEFFQTRFSRFLAWRDFGFPESGAFNCFSMAALRSADGAFLVGEMGPAHSVAGALYFPAGTPDLSDVKDGTVDLAGSVLRELREETGVAAEAQEVAAGWTLVFDGPRIACMKTIQSKLGASALKAQVEAFLSAEYEPELSAVHMISRRDQLGHPRLTGFMRRFLLAALSA